MQFGDLALNLIFPNREYVKYMGEVSSTVAIDNREIDSKGLYSIETFGPLGSEERMQRFGYIDLYLPIIHPKIYQILIKISSLYKGIILSTKTAKFDSRKRDFIADPDGETGYSFFMKHIYELKITKESDSSEFDNSKKLFYKYQSKRLLTNDKLLVLPAGMRDINIEDDNRVTEDEINEYYKKVISAASMLEGERNINPSLDFILANLQEKVNELYSAILLLLKGKKKFIGGHVTGRSIDYSTRNIATGKQKPIEDLANFNEDVINTTIFGLYQFIKSAEPFVKHHVNELYISRLFNTADYRALLFDPKLKRMKEVSLPNDEIERFTTSKGLTTLFNRMVDSYVRQIEVPIGDYLLLPVYDSGDRVEIYLDDESIPDEYRGKLRGITYGELLYTAIYPKFKELLTTVTRYPIAEEGGIFISYVDVNTTTEIRKVNLKIKSQFDTKELTIENYPRLDSEYNDSLGVPYTRSSGLGLDFDGDSITTTILLTDEALEEGKKFINSKMNYLYPNGKWKQELIDYIVDIVLKSMTKESKGV